MKLRFCIEKCCNKNITFISNLFYSTILVIFALTSNKQADWLFPAIFFPFTFFLNEVIKRLIYNDRHDKTKQEIGMYLLAVYAFISVILLYARFFHDQAFETAIYILIYYAIVVISLYQSKSLIMWSSVECLQQLQLFILLGLIILSRISGLEIFEF